MLMISYWLNYQWSALNPYPYHAVNVVLHAFNSILAALIVRRLLGWVGQTGWMREAVGGLRGRAVPAASGADRIGGLCREPVGDDERVLLPGRVRGVRMPRDGVR